ncbi:LOW QUALITY PROTEIN: SLAM family member 7-like [Sylvia atricapilla]|uniref:LOW QUALITY PROTEIN: SLAM family member 7-like n=1 Tax=Sylvia atricapilla TaxID=48155 RepID=UPI00339A9779
MEEFWIQLLAILTLLTQTCSASDTPELIGAVGGVVTFRIPDTDTGGNVAFWNFGDDPIVTVPFKDPSEPLFSKEYETRCTVSESGRALSISQLRMEDAGTYSVTAGEKKSTFTLLVYRELTEPTVTCEAQNCSGGICNFSLSCSVPGDGFGNVSYTWTRWGEQWEGESVEFPVNKSSLDNLEPLSCTARNAVSIRSVTATNPGGLCSGALSGSGAKIWVLVGVAVGVILLLFLVVFCKSQGWKKFHLPESKPSHPANTVYAEVGLSQQRIPNGIKPTPVGVESSSTIYSLVKRPEQVENGTVTGLELV